MATQMRGNAAPQARTRNCMNLQLSTLKYVTSAYSCVGASPVNENLGGMGGSGVGLEGLAGAHESDNTWSAEVFYMQK